MIIREIKRRPKPNRSLRVRILLLVLLNIIVLVSFFLVLSYHKQSLEESYLTKREELENQYRIIVGIYQRMSSAIYHLFIDTQEILSVVALGMGSSDPAVQRAARIELQEQLGDLYSELLLHNFRQLHFHQSDNTSFYRFHRPEKFGDDLTGVRTSVARVNASGIPVSGFEEGRIFNGYRFVYPLVYQGAAIGSVEVSISMGTVVDELERLFGKKVDFILKREVVEEKVFAEEIASFYTPWSVSENYYFDNAIKENVVIHPDSPDDTQRILTMIEENESFNRSFSMDIHRNGSSSILSFIPIINFEEETVGWFLSADAAVLHPLQTPTFFLLIVVILLLFFLLVIFSSYYLYTQKKIEQMASHDALTGLFTRSVFLQHLEREEERYHRYAIPYTLIMIDIDHFKRINDTYGHLAGDAVLKKLSRLLEKNLRQTDILSRFGGEEFIVLLAHTTLDQALEVAEKLRISIEDAVFTSAGRVTISLGVADRTEELISAEDLVRAADDCLYQAKEEGRNRVVG